MVYTGNPVKNGMMAEGTLICGNPRVARTVTSSAN